MPYYSKNTITKGIDVIVVFKARAIKTHIYKVKCGTTEYLIDKLGFNYDKKIGDTRYHIFGVQSGNTFLILSFNTQALSWQLLEINFFS